MNNLKSRIGLANKKDIICFRKQFMSDGNTNLLFCSNSGKLLGTSRDNRISNRNWNVIVVGEPHEVRDNYILPNLDAMHSSSVIIGDDGICDERKEQYKTKECHVYTIDTRTDAEHTSRFNPLLHMAKRNKKIMPNQSDEIHFRRLLYSMAETIMWYYGQKNMVEFLHSKRPETEDKLEQRKYDTERHHAEAVRFILKIALEYVCTEKDLPKGQRTFRTAYNTLMNLIEEDNEGSEKCLTAYNKYSDGWIAIWKNNLPVHQFSISSDCDDIMSVPADWIREAALCLQVLSNCICFTEDDDTDNVSIQELANELTYVFVKDDFTYAQTNGFLTTIMADLLYAYGESDLPNNQTYQFLPQNVFFYIRNFPFIPLYNFWHLFCTCRPYGIGFSLGMRSLEEMKFIERYGCCGETITCNADTHLFFGLSLNPDKSITDIAYIQKNIPLYNVNGKIKTYQQFHKMINKKRFVGTTAVIPYKTIPAMTEQEIQETLASGKMFLLFRNFYPILGDRLEDKK